VTPDGVVAGDVLLAGDRIVDPAARPSADAASRSIDVGGLVLAPGFVDLQVNGGYGIDLTSALVTHPERLWELAAWLPRQGVTAFLPTMVSAPSSALDAALTALRTPPPPGHLGAVPLGLHVEGPMLSEAKRGTHDAAHLRPPTTRLVASWSRRAGIALVTLAPELPDALEVVRALVSRDVVVSVGHTAGSFEAVAAAFAAGARAGTHLFNAMSGWSGRDPGTVGALLADGSAVAGLIVDGVHLHPGTVAAVWRALGTERIALVTDAVAASGTDGGRHVLGGRALRVAQGAVRDEDGALAGSVLTMDRAVRGLVASSDARFDQALRAASETPARLLGETDRGRLAAGARADLVVLTPDLEVVATLVGGQVAACPRPDLIDLPRWSDHADHGMQP
jgi:N-acetylglucosamine-6-phosphate deacetylase